MVSTRGEYSNIELREIYLKEEIYAEKRINRIMLGVSGFFLLFSLLLPFINKSTFNDLGYISDAIGASISLLYQCVNFILLRKGRHSKITKYLTLFVSISTITVVLYGYHYDNDFVHSIRSVTASAYFMAIVLSGLYQNPRTPLFAGLICSLEYGLLCILARLNGTPFLASQETFKTNVLTSDVVLTYLIFLVGTGILMYLNSVRQQKLMNELRDSSLKANFFENYDELTGLPNLKHFKDRLTGQLVKAEKRRQFFAVMSLGLDGFHNINQLHGHDFGNNILKETGRRFLNAFREDDFICRFMGDRFLITFADLKTDLNISDLIRKTRAALEKPFRFNDTEIRLTATGGLCTFPDDADTADDLIKKAESAMHSAKKQGKDRYFLFNKESQNSLEHRLRIERELEKAYRKQEFRLVYQPKVNTGGRIIGLESLVRWESHSLGDVRPDIFIPIAERSGLIVPIGYEVFRKCCIQLNAWDAAGIRNVRTSVNVSPVQFAQKDFVESIRRIVAETSVDTSWLGIEITESGIIDNETECIQKLAELKNMGFSISIDDFGKGYSSLSRLGNYPLDTLKIDKAFVDGLPHSNVSVCLVRSIINLAQNLNYSVIAEGVEDEEQVNFLKENGCTGFQGYHFYKPLPPEELAGILKSE